MRSLLLPLAGAVFCVGSNASAAIISAGPGCAPTAESAVARVLSNDVESASVEGFKVVAIRKDPLRKRSWAMIASCSNTSRPMVAIELAENVVPLTPPQQHVQIGDHVTVRQYGEESQMELAGVAEDSGVTQDLIRVRLSALSSGNAAPVLRCRVVNKNLVEVVR
jgi:hypothetical protein